MYNYLQLCRIGKRNYQGSNFGVNIFYHLKLFRGASNGFFGGKDYLLGGLIAINLPLGV